MKNNDLQNLPIKALDYQLKLNKLIFYCFAVGLFLLVLGLIIIYFANGNFPLRFPYLLFVPLPIFILNYRKKIVEVKEELAKRNK